MQIIGIDISKGWFDCFNHHQAARKQFANTPEGWDWFGRSRLLEQINKGTMIFWSVALVVILCSWYGINSLIEYGSHPNLFDLITGLAAWGGLIVFLVYAAKEYYTIRSSMSLLLKLLNNNKKQNKR